MNEKRFFVDIISKRGYDVTINEMAGYRIIFWEVSDTVTEMAQKEKVGQLKSGHVETTGGVSASVARIGEQEFRKIHFPAMQESLPSGPVWMSISFK